METQAFKRSSYSECFHLFDWRNDWIKAYSCWTIGNRKSSHDSVLVFVQFKLVGYHKPNASQSSKSNFPKPCSRSTNSRKHRLLLKEAIRVAVHFYIGLFISERQPVAHYANTCLLSLICLLFSLHLICCHHSTFL